MATLALGMGVVAAAQAVENGSTVEEAAEIAQDHYRRTHCFFLVDTLEYLRRGGRIGRVQEVVGSMLKLKPLLSLQHGEVALVGRARTRQKAIEELVRRASELRPFQELIAVHATTPEDLDHLVQRLRGFASDARVTVSRITPVIGVHAGPGLLAFGVVTPPDSASPPTTGA
jgi:DegV family protein with EDD domain